MPLEARMYGIFAGFLLTWGIAQILKRGRAVLMASPWMLAVFGVFIVLMGLDGINATLFDLNGTGIPVPFLYSPRLDLRLGTGLLAGIAMGGIMLPVVNYALWRDGHAQPIFSDVRDLATVVVWNAILYLSVVSGSGLFLYPASLLGVLGVIALLGALNLVFLMSILRRTGAARNLWETLNPAAASILLTAVELGGLSLVRYALLGTTVLP